jgi:DNA repair photolyase
LILSVSRRTDIPAFYADWFMNRIKEQFVLVRNPFNTKQISKISLNKDVIDCIVFWTKNPRELMKYLDELKDYKYYFQFTLTAYDQSVESNVPEKKTLIKTFIDLSEKIGKDKVIWRYDPILLTEKFDKEYHYKWFEYLAQRLHSYTEKCVISFLDLYNKTKRNLKSVEPLQFVEKDMIEIAAVLSQIAKKYNLAIETCSESLDLSFFNIQHSKCIDDKLISRIIGDDVSLDKDPNQREECGCVKSIDIGAYNTCNHHCLYCYANFNKEIVDKNCLSHDKNSPLLFGELLGDEVISERTVESFRSGQVSIDNFL